MRPIPTIRQSLAWWTFAQSGIEPERLLAEAAEIGYRGVEILDERYWPLAHRAGLEIVAICGQESQQQGFNNPDNHASLRREVRDNLALAAENRIGFLILFVGERIGTDDATAIRMTADGIAPLIDSAAQAGVTLLIEPMNSIVDHPGQQCDRLGWALQVVNALDTPHVQIAYDIYHMQLMEGNIIGSIRRHRARIGHIQTAGVPGRGRLDGSQELNYRAIARAIADCGYTGFVSHEFFPSGNPVEALREAYRIFDVSCDIDYR